MSAAKESPSPNYKPGYPKVEGLIFYFVRKEKKNTGG